MSENTSIDFKLIIPKGVGIEQAASFVKVPGTGGEVGVLPNHTASLVLLKAGELQLNHGEEKEFYFVSEGTAHISETAVTVLTPHLEKVSDIDTNRAKKSLKRAEERLSAKNQDGIDRDRAIASKTRAEVRLDMYKRHHVS